MSVASFNLATMPLLKEVARRYPEVVIVAYADDITFMAPEVDMLQAVVSLAEEYAQDMGWKLNGGKTQYFGWDKQPAVPLQVAGAAVQLQQNAKVLGVVIGESTPQQRADAHGALQKDLATLESLPLSAKQKGHVIASMIAPKHYYDLEVSMWTTKQESEIRSKVLRLLAPLVTPPRCPYTLSAIWGKAHLTDPFAARLKILLRRYRLLLKMGHNQWRLPTEETTGPRGWLIAFLRRIDGALTNEGEQITFKGGFAYRMVQAEDRGHDHRREQHLLRNALRDALFGLARNRSDARGLEDGINWDVTLNMLRALPAGRATILLTMVLSGGVQTGERVARWSGKGIAGLACRYCGEDDTIVHRFWFCRRWTSFRPQGLPAADQFPQATLHRGLFSAGE